MPQIPGAFLNSRAEYLSVNSAPRSSWMARRPKSAVGVRLPPSHQLQVSSLFIACLAGLDQTHGPYFDALTFPYYPKKNGSPFLGFETWRSAPERLSEAEFALTHRRALADVSG